MTVLSPSSGNVFQDLGFGPEEGEHLRIRSALMAAVCRYMDERGLTQSEAAKIFGVTQPRISNLVRGGRSPVRGSVFTGPRSTRT
jgi:predicted XRE-type DNA-binding protein